MQQIVTACRELRQKITLLTSAPGVGFITAVLLAVRLPELGAISRKKLAGRNHVDARPSSMISGYFHDSSPSVTVSVVIA